MEFRQFNNSGGRYDGGHHDGGGVTVQMEEDRHTDQ